MAEAYAAGVRMGLLGVQVMKSRESLIRLKKFQVDEKRRQVTQIEMMIADFERMAAELDQQIEIEQEAGIHDPAHFAYSTFAKAAIARRDNLLRSADDLEDQLEDAHDRAGRGRRGPQEGRTARPARADARAGRRECARAGRHGPHRRDAAARRSASELHMSISCSTRMPIGCNA